MMEFQNMTWIPNQKLLGYTPPSPCPEISLPPWHHIRHQGDISKSTSIFHSTKPVWEAKGAKKIHGFHKLRRGTSVGMFFQNSEVPYPSYPWTAPILRMKFLLHVPFLQQVGRKFDSWHEEDWRLGFLPTLGPNGLCWGLLRPKSCLKSIANVRLYLWRARKCLCLIWLQLHGTGMPW